MDRKLIEQHIEEKLNKKVTNKKYGTYYENNILQICFYSTGCRYSKTGGCTICDYGESRKENLKPEDIKDIMQEVFENLKEKPKVLLLNSLGSVLDELEMPRDNLIVLLDEVKKTDINVIVFETHYRTINQEILELIKEKLKSKEIDIELGLESSNKEYREKYLNKLIDNDKYIETIKLIKKHGFSVESNIIFGMPFLTIDEQIQDTLESIKWCFDNNIDEVNLFPINIKPYTLLYKLYEEGKYNPVYHKDFIELLKRIPKNYIDKINLAWYGNRELPYEGKKTILPVCNSEDYDRIMEFYHNFNSNRKQKYRIELLNNFKI